MTTRTATLTSAQTNALLTLLNKLESDARLLSTHQLNQGQDSADAWANADACGDARATLLNALCAD